MSRLKNFSRNLTASYLQLAVNVVYSLASIPLILHWLPRAEFGMWAVLLQLMSYIANADLGMTSALARLLVDYKDKRGDGQYGSLIKTAFLVSLVQGGIIVLATFFLSPLLATLMKIEPEYHSTFVLLMRVQGLIAAFSYVIRPLGLMLYAHQRMDIQAYNEMTVLLTGLGLLVLFLSHGGGIYSFLYANVLTALIGPVFMFWNCRRLHVLPQAGEWGHASWKIFQEIFNYGKDVFLLGLGMQLQVASQTIIVARSLGLEAAAAWSVGTKMFSLVVPLMCRPYGAALPGLYEMLARGEIERLKNRFRAIVLLTASLGAFLGGSFILCNSLFVQIWLNGKIVWSPWNDVLLGLWLFLLSMQTTHSCFVSVTKQIGGMRYIFFGEGCTFFILALLLGGHWGGTGDDYTVCYHLFHCHWSLPGMVLVSILCTLAFTYQYSLRRSRDYFHGPLEEFAMEWVRPSLKLAGWLALVVPLIWFTTAGLPVVWRLVARASLDVLVGGFLFLRIGLPAALVQEAATRLPRPAARLLQLLVR
jgi:O-antigen/teichoic acid export membrane protein